MNRERFGAHLVSFGFVAPATLILLIGLLYPLLTTVQLALYDWGLGTPWDSKEFVGLQWFARLARDPDV